MLDFWRVGLTRVVLLLFLCEISMLVVVEELLFEERFVCDG